MKKIILFAIFLVAVIVSCQKEVILPPQAEDFDRSPMLENWVDNIIIPAHEAYNVTTTTLHASAVTFSASPTMANLEALRTAWFESYKAWQNVPFFYEGRGNDQDVLIALYTNTYPTKNLSIDFFVESGTYNLTLSNSKAAQGLPALDYMLYGLADTDDAILSFYTTNGNAANYKKYLTDVTARIKTLSDVVYNDWNNEDTRNKFVADDGNTVFSSVNRVVNDFIYSYEFDIRTSKIGFPSGSCVSCSGRLKKGYVEAPYRGDISKILLLEALDAAQDFYNGVAFNGPFEKRGTSLYDYLDFLGTEKDGEKLSDLINTQFNKSRMAIEKLNDDFASEIENRNELMIDAHTELQLNVLYLKACMMNHIKVGYDQVRVSG